MLINKEFAKRKIFIKKTLRESFSGRDKNESLCHGLKL
jgi:hypothetical protein